MNWIDVNKNLEFEYLPMLSKFVKSSNDLKWKDAVHDESDSRQFSEVFCNALAMHSDRITIYTDFITQALSLWMFVPCDKDGNMLSEPEHYNEWESEYKKGFVHLYDSSIMKQYQQAKERVLFEGWSVTMANKYSIVVNNEKQLFNFLTTGEVQGTYSKDVYDTIEQAINDKFKLIHK